MPGTLRVSRELATLYATLLKSRDTWLSITAIANQINAPSDNVKQQIYKLYKRGIMERSNGTWPHLYRLTADASDRCPVDVANLNKACEVFVPEPTRQS